MSQQQKSVTWSTHEFNIYTTNTTWNDVAGIYIFTMVNKDNFWIPLYIGQADSFKNRLSDHNKWDAAKRLGMTHVHAKSVGKQTDRDAIEKELIKKYQPTLNTQLK